ncbi:hypothetical protein J7E91_15855 [Streptomyces sp. ISL-99]|nr:hypothetical protein [Streptomyces sp. ISL-99]
MNMQEAADHAEEILDKTADSLHPPLEWDRGPSSDPICTDFKNDATGKGSVTRRRYALTIISPERRDSFMGVVERHWKKSGYKITSVRNHKEMPAIFASTPENFRMVLKIGYKGQAFVDVSSPCVTESQVTEPPMPPIDPADPASKGLPYIRSDFWSAETSS